MLDALASSPLTSALIGGLLSLAATWWTLRRGFKNQVQILEDEARQRQRSAGWALIAEMSENLARLQALSKLANAEAPTVNMQELLRLNREVLDGQLPVLGLSLGPEMLRTLVAAYVSVENLLAILQGKWRIPAQVQPASKQDVKSLDFAMKEFEKALRIIATGILTSDEVKKAGLEIMA